MVPVLSTVSALADLDGDTHEELAVSWDPHFGDWEDGETTLFGSESMRGTVTQADAFYHSWSSGIAYTSEDMLGDATPDLLMATPQAWVYVIDGSRIGPELPSPTPPSHSPHTTPASRPWRVPSPGDTAPSRGSARPRRHPRTPMNQQRRRSNADLGGPSALVGEAEAPAPARSNEERIAELGMGPEAMESVDVPEVGPTPSPVDHPMLRKGSAGDDVRLCQRRLSIHGADLVEDGDFGPRTDSAVRSFQASSGLDADGIVGPLTWAALDAGMQATVKADQGDHQVTGTTTTGAGESTLDEIDALFDRMTADTTEFRPYISAGVLDPEIASTLAHLRDLGGDAQYAYVQAKEGLSDGSLIGMQFQHNRDAMLARKLGRNDPDAAYFRNSMATPNGLVFDANADHSRGLVLVGDSYKMEARAFAIDLAHELNHARNAGNKEKVEADSSEDLGTSALTAPQLNETRQKFVQEMVARHAEWWTAWTLRMNRLGGSLADVPRPTADELYMACNNLAISFVNSPIYDPFGHWATLSTRQDDAFNQQVGAWMRLVHHEEFSGNPYRDMESQALFLEASTHVTANAEPVGLGSIID